MATTTMNLRRRAQRPEVKSARAAIAAVLPVRQQIGHWQLTAARLKMLYVYGQEPEAKSAVASEACELLQLVRSAAATLEADARDLPPVVGRNSHFQDVVRALGSVTATLETFASPRPHPDMMRE